MAEPTIDHAEGIAVNRRVPLFQHSATQPALVNRVMSDSGIELRLDLDGLRELPFTAATSITVADGTLEMNRRSYPVTLEIIPWSKTTSQIELRLTKVALTRRRTRHALRLAAREALAELCNHLPTPAPTPSEPTKLVATAA